MNWDTITQINHQNKYEQNTKQKQERTTTFKGPSRRTHGYRNDLNIKKKLGNNTKIK